MKHLARMRSAVPGLDQVLNGGFVEGASYIIQGRPGAGKTILANQIAFARAATGAKVLYVTLLAESHERLFQSMATLTFFDEEVLGREVTFVSVFHTLREEGLDAVVQLLRQETKRQQATLLVFDGLLNARDRAATDLDVKTFVAAVQGQAAFVGCTVLFLTSARLEDNSPEYTMVDGVIDLSEHLFGVRTIRQMQVRKSRGSKSISGVHQYEISDSGITVYPRLEALNWPEPDSVPGRRRVGSGNVKFDVLLNGGYPESSVTLLAGPSGSGKTSLGLQFLSVATPEEPALHFGFFEDSQALIAKASAIKLSLPTADSGALQIHCNLSGENLLDKLGHELLDLVEKNRTRRVFIDGLNGFALAAVDKQRLIPFVAALAARLRRLNVTVLVTWEVQGSLDASARALPLEFSGIFDNLVLVRQWEQHHDLHRSIAIQKMRDSTFNAEAHALLFSDAGIGIGAGLGATPRTK
ncbi:ATPase domain-containing protein [Achromobacter aloeverae]|uniref:Serine/threonine protein kinase n=1 Tax=Achromobacter aloeverae TaxID=1750518 RepID=A0A4Q1HQA0_9BURK|nr:ATPase domain-containing protein [Achromobacter aloeverae]RXN92215.1 serine/threonine protein kinase [Achromobacter aloeverae]